MSYVKDVLQHAANNLAYDIERGLEDIATQRANIEREEARVKKSQSDLASVEAEIAKH